MQIVPFSFLMIFAVFYISGSFLYRNGHVFGKKTHGKVTNNNNKTQWIILNWNILCFSSRGSCGGVVAVVIRRTLVPSQAPVVLCRACKVCLMRCPAMDRVYCAVNLSSVAHGNLMAVPVPVIWMVTLLDYWTLEQLGHLSAYPPPVHT